MVRQQKVLVCLKSAGEANDSTQAHKMFCYFLLSYSLLLVCIVSLEKKCLHFDG